MHSATSFPSNMMQACQAARRRLILMNFPYALSLSYATEFLGPLRVLGTRVAMIIGSSPSC